MTAPSSSADFDRAYRAPFTFWGDVRIPREIEAVVREQSPRTALELGCGVGRFSRWVARQGVEVTGVDFSPVAIEKAKLRVADDDAPPRFVVGDVTRLDAIDGPFDLAFDVGCFHCFDLVGQRAYVREARRLVRPGGTLLVWALDGSPSDLVLSSGVVRDVFAPAFVLREAHSSRRRLARSHWYRLTRSPL